MLEPFIISGDRNLEFDKNIIKKLGVQMKRLLGDGTKLQNTRSLDWGIVVEGRPSGDYVHMLAEFQEDGSGARYVAIYAIKGRTKYCLDLSIYPYTGSHIVEFTVGHVSQESKRKFVENELHSMADGNNPGTEADIVSLTELLSRTQIDTESQEKQIDILIASGDFKLMAPALP